MALFSDNPFAGVFRAQKRREAEVAMGQQQAMAEQEQQKQKLSGQRLEQLRSTPSDLRGLEAIRRSDSFNVYGLGGSTPWTTRAVTDPQTGAIKRMPVLKQGYTQVGQGASLDSRPIMAKGPLLAPAGKTVGVMGAGTAFKQEYRGIREALGRGGATVIEAPEKFVRGKGTSERDSARQFYSEVTGRPMGSLLGTGAYGGFGKNAVDEQENPLAKYSPQIMERRAKRGQNPFTAESTGRFTETNRLNKQMLPTEEEEPSSIFGEYFGSPFGGFRFPFAGY